ncbi:GroES-like protein [Dentipellis sp. KUC8613]|nr:GroES-like protein [Dentipellis sp. KUC8613]
MAPTKMNAVVIEADGKIVVRKIDVPKPGPGELLVKVSAAAQNPADWKSVAFGKRTGAVVGCDYTGTVEEIGPDVPAGLWEVGDRASGFVQGSTWPNGAFAEYTVTPAEVTIHVPDSWSVENAAHLGAAPLTAIQALWQSHDDLPTPLKPTSTPFPILVYGASSSVGQFVVQFAKLSGLYVVATASPKNFDLVKSLGADEVFDYHDPEVGKKIKAATGGKLKHAVDNIFENGSPQIISDALSDEGGKIASLSPYESPRPGVTVLSTVAYHILGKSFDFPFQYTEDPHLTQLGKNFAKLLEGILAKYDIKPNPLLVFPNGLASVADGFQFMIDGKVSGQKITYRISDTPK